MSLQVNSSKSNFSSQFTSDVRSRGITQKRYTALLLFRLLIPERYAFAFSFTRSSFTLTSHQLCLFLVSHGSDQDQE